VGFGCENNSHWLTWARFGGWAALFVRQILRKRLFLNPHLFITSLGAGFVRSRHTSVVAGGSGVFWLWVSSFVDLYFCSFVVSLTRGRSDNLPKIFILLWALVCWYELRGGSYLYPHGAGGGVQSPRRRTFCVGSCRIRNGGLSVFFPLFFYLPRDVFRFFCGCVVTVSFGAWLDKGIPPVPLLGGGCSWGGLFVLVCGWLGVYSGGGVGGLGSPPVFLVSRDYPTPLTGGVMAIHYYVMAPSPSSLLHNTYQLCFRGGGDVAPVCFLPAVVWCSCGGWWGFFEGCLCGVLGEKHILCAHLWSEFWGFPP